MPEINPPTHEKLFPEERKEREELKLEEWRKEVSARLGELYDEFDRLVERGDQVKIALDEGLAAPEYDKLPGRYDGLLNKMEEADKGLDQLSEAIDRTQSDLMMVEDELDRMRREKIARTTESLVK